MLLSKKLQNSLISHHLRINKITKKPHQICKYTSPRVVMIKASKRLARGRRDLFSGQRRNKANAVSFSNKKSRKWQGVNIQNKMIYWPEGQRLVKLRISSRTI